MKPDRKCCLSCDLSDECAWGRDHPNGLCRSWMPLRQEGRLIPNILFFAILECIAIGVTIHLALHP